MGKKWLVFVMVLFSVACILATGKLALAAEDIVMETYKVVSGPGYGSTGGIIFKGKPVLRGFGYMELISVIKGLEMGKVSDHTFHPEKAVEKEGYKEITFSKTWEEAGFTYKTKTELYPTKFVYTISYSFTKEWIGHIYTNPSIDQSFILGARYKATDIWGKVSEGEIGENFTKYTIIPRYSIKEMEIYPISGGTIRFKLENKDNASSFNGIAISPKGEGKYDIRLNLIQNPYNEIFPAGYTNQMKLELELKE